MKKQSLVVIIILTILINACKSNKFEVDISGINIELKIKRLDLDLMENYPDIPDVYKLTTDYGTFLDLYGYKVLNIGGVNQKEFGQLLLDFNEYCLDFHLPSLVEKEFGDFSKTTAELEQAFKYYKYYFPDKKIPVVYTYFSNFTQSVITDEGLIGIGLDKYLGVDCELYGRLGFDNYKVKRMHPEMLPVDCMRGWAMAEFPYNDSIDNMLSQMVHEGKIQYFIDAMLPFAPDSLKFGYTKQQFEWADYNEGNMWTYLIDNKFLFSSDATSIRKMVGDGPFTTLFANNSAPRAGAFLGWKIVHQYMENNPNVSLKELMLNTDYQGILNKARYKP